MDKLLRYSATYYIVWILNDIYVGMAWSSRYAVAAEKLVAQRKHKRIVRWKLVLMV